MIRSPIKCELQFVAPGDTDEVCELGREGCPAQSPGYLEFICIKSYRQYETKSSVRLVFEALDHDVGRLDESRRRVALL